MPTGKLKKFVADKGFGFITPDEGGDDIFAHTLQFSGDADGLKGGERVTYETEWDDRKGKTRAGKWSVDFSGAGASGAAMKTGKLKKYFSDKGFGFIEPDDGSEDLFAHSRQFSGGDPEDLQEGAKVRFEEEWDSKKNKNKAGTWMLDNGGPAGGGGGCGGAPGYGHPPPQGYGAPPPGYGGAPCYGGPPPGYGAPAPGYGQPPPGGCYGPMGGAPPGGDPRFSPYGQPPGGYGAPAPGYGAPAPGYGAPAPGYGAPAPCYGGPPMGGGAPSLPPGWEQHNDPASGKPYFCNRSTGETSWTPPAGAPAPAPAPAMAPPGGGAPPLPAGWESAPDPASGKTYYFNRASGETKWEPPQ